MSVQEPKEQFEREQTESTEESQDFTVETPLTESDSLTSASEPGPVDVPTEEVVPASSDDSDLTDEPEPADDIPADGNLPPPLEEAAHPEAAEGPAWFVIHCYSGYENKVRHNLEQRIETMGMKDKIFDVVIPTQEEIEVKDGKRRTVERHIFPGYVLVNMQLTEESWYVVRNTPGVTGFVGMGNQPTPLRPEEVSQIIKRMEAEAPTVKVSFKVGERVRIIDGPFNDFRGVVAEIDMERTKVRVLVSFFGRETPVELDFLQVEKS
jgi:transcription termination/antitermination protein NusG